MTDYRTERAYAEPVDTRAIAHEVDDINQRLLALECQRPPREDYVRITREAHGYVIEPAVEYRDGDDFQYVARELEIAVLDWARNLTDQMAAARAVAKGIQHRWPDRAYFVEVWQDGREGFAQVFQPYGVPRNR